VKTHEKGIASIIRQTRVSLAPVLRAAVRQQDHSRSLEFSMQHQRHSNWCWAAVATSIALYYDPESKWTQCGVANRNLHRRNCCEKGSKCKCNVTGHLRHVLRLVRHAKRPCEIKRRIPFSRVEREIDAERPLGVRTQWRGGKEGHFLTIVGYHREFELLTVADPLFGRSHWHYGAFSKNYRHSGEWKNSYYTKP
jgi:Papain-like cysteine protease AvrRpt2